MTRKCDEENGRGRAIKGKPMKMFLCPCLALPCVRAQPRKRKVTGFGISHIKRHMTGLTAHFLSSLRRCLFTPSFASVSSPSHILLSFPSFFFSFFSSKKVMSHINNPRRRHPRAALHLRQNGGNPLDTFNPNNQQTTSTDPNPAATFTPSDFPTPVPVEPSTTQSCMHPLFICLV